MFGLLYGLVVGGAALVSGAKANYRDEIARTEVNEDGLWMDRKGQYRDVKTNKKRYYVWRGDDRVIIDEHYHVIKNLSAIKRREEAVRNYNEIKDYITVDKTVHKILRKDDSVLCKLYRDKETGHLVHAVETVYPSLSYISTMIFWYDIETNRILRPTDEQRFIDDIRKEVGLFCATEEMYNTYINAYNLYKEKFNIPNLNDDKYIDYNFNLKYTSKEFPYNKITRDSSKETIKYIKDRTPEIYYKECNYYENYRYLIWYSNIEYSKYYLSMCSEIYDDLKELIVNRDNYIDKPNRVDYRDSKLNKKISSIEIHRDLTEWHKNDNNVKPTLDEPKTKII